MYLVGQIFQDRQQMNKNSVGELPFQMYITPSLMDTNTEFQRMQRENWGKQVQHKDKQWDCLLICIN